VYPPVTAPALGLFGLVLLAVFALIEINIIQAACERLGISHRTGIIAVPLA
jgi:hypothetical protein